MPVHSLEVFLLDAHCRQFNPCPGGLIATPIPADIVTMRGASRAAVLFLSAALAGACGGGKSATSPSPTPGSTPALAPTGQRFALSGLVLGYDAAPLSGVVIEVVDARLPDGTFRVLVAGQALAMGLPNHTQPGDMVLICAYALMNVRMMLLSKIGTQYDPVSGKGTVGRNYCYQTSAGARLMFEEIGRAHV